MNKFEQIKAERDGLDVIPDILRYAESGWKSITEEDKVRMKCYCLLFRKHTPGHFLLMWVQVRLAAVARLILSSVLALVSSACLIAQPALAAPDDPDYDVPGGHFFTEAVTNPSQAGLGYTVVDGGGVALWTAFQNAGGVFALGYPISRRFELNSGQQVAQAFSQAVLVWSRSTANAAVMPAASVGGGVPAYARDPEQPPVAAANIEPFPWSGWWWPASPGIGPTLFGVDGPLDKYDRYVEANGGDDPVTRDWERSNVYFPGISWAGHCNGYAAAALLEPEPTEAVSAAGITFTVADLKGLLADYHFADSAAWSYGEDANVNPADFHRMLLDWLQRQDKGFVLSFDLGGGETWSYPLGRFESEWAPDAVEDGLWHVTTTAWMADMNVPADFVGTRLYPSEAGKTFTYDVYGDPRHPSDGVWTGASASGRFAHPGRIWYPAVGAPVANTRELVSPGLNHATLERILGG